MNRQRSVTLAILLAGGLAACGPVGATVENNNANQNANQNWNQNVNTNVDAAVVGGLVTLRGRVWSPGADVAETLEANRFPIPGAAVIAYHVAPPELPQGRYCNECVEVPAGTPNVIADPVSGEFELQLMPGQTYFLTIQKGEFRRVRQVTVPNTPDQEWTFDYGADGPRPEELTLPNRTSAGDNMPKIAIIDAAYEDMSLMFDSLGFTYPSSPNLPGDIVLIDNAGALVNSETELNKYNLIIAPCGEEWPGGNGAALKEWVRNGGKLYVDDFNYDFVEQVWPEFLTFYQDADELSFGQSGSGMGECGAGVDAPVGFNVCNSWKEYDFNGTPGDADFDAWLALSDVNRGAGLFFVDAWDFIYSMGEGEVGITDECTGTCGPNGEVYMLPKVWMYNTDAATIPFSGNPPATVSWPFYCGKVLYTVYHTKADFQAELKLQEKIMMYLIMEIQTCSSGPIVQ